ncbi:YfcC family protein [Peptoniphilus equinus]|uniref:YfcC family protein n=1 Tax=Peptoniphilus equinus TaxID=3016343 RepID=A0ABY7QQZ2_9FIRM|nr:YfcC family protein [Peptoniphilus equinus]WBW49219.1 YfcC family protein [Peptoniphilus equinus]
METKQQKKKRTFPTALTVLFLVLAFACVLTYVIPAGQYQRMSYNSDSGFFEVVDQSGNVTELPGEQKTLDDLNISITMDKFTGGDITKPIAVPNTYQSIESNPQGIGAFLKAPIDGVVDTADIMIFILMIGGNIGILNASGSINAGMAALSKKTKGKEFLLLVVIYLLIALGGTTFGLAEETIALYPILMPVFFAAGYDAMTLVAVIFMASSVGTMFSTVNPFSIIIGSTAAGINFKLGLGMRVIGLIGACVLNLFFIYRYANRVKNDPSRSVVSLEMAHLRELQNESEADGDYEFTTSRKLTLLIFMLGFPIMVWGDFTQGWWFTEMSAIFMVTAMLNMVISGLGEKQAVNTFLAGAADLVSVAIVCGVARAVNIVMDNGMISDTILYYTANFVDGMNGGIFSVVHMGIFSILGLFIPSSSGLATLSMPIFAPLADTVNISRDVVVTAYNYGQGWMAFLTPTGLILPSLELAGVPYDKWIKWVAPFLGVLAVFAIIMLVIATYI